MNKYDASKIEAKWQEKWEQEGLYAAKEGSSNKLYVLDMFPYPSGSGLHVGHVEGYTATDIYSRFKRMNGYSVLHPMGWDAFGLPAENYAIKTKIHPKETTDQAIKTFTKQIKSLGLSYDWSREIGTHAPEYYKWTQWFFSLLYKNNLAYKAKGAVNWCDSCKTVLANEQVVAGSCERCGTQVMQKDLEQWFFKITDFAEDLIQDLDRVDWPASTILNQRNWIGKSEGALLKFKVKDLDITFEVFDSVPQTFMAQTFTVIAPEHPMVHELVKGTDREKEVMEFVDRVKAKKAAGKFDIDKEIEGIFIGRYLEYTPSGRSLPIWVATFVLAHYGSGVVNASAHDERDFAFAKKYDLPLHPVMFPEDPKEAERVKNLEYAYCKAVDGILEEPVAFRGRKWGEVREDILRYIETNGLGKRSVQYKLRDWLVSRQRYWGAPIPIVYDPQGKPHLVPEEHLPWLLPTDVEFLPTGVSPLAQSRELSERTEKIFGKGWKPEVDTMDTFVCSSWYYFRFADPKNEKEFASKKAIEQWLPVDMYMGGAEHTVLHLMYARFFTKVLKKLGYISFDEPFLKLRHQGIILGENNQKMSKSKGNVVNPDDIVAKFGADALRMYEMFLGPLDEMKPWSSKNIVGVQRFLDRVWEYVQKEEGEEADGMESLRHRTVKKVTEDIESMRYNTAIASLMEYVNACFGKSTSRVQKEALVLLLAPFAPHLAEEMWEMLGNRESVHKQKWPSYDESQLEEKTRRIAVQVNGKVREVIEVLSEASEEEMKAKALASENVRKWLEGKEPKKVICVQGKIVSIVI